MKSSSLTEHNQINIENLTLNQIFPLWIHITVNTIACMEDLNTIACLEDLNTRYTYLLHAKRRRRIPEGSQRLDTLAWRKLKHGHVDVLWHPKCTPITFEDCLSPQLDWQGMEAPHYVLYVGFKDTWQLFIQRLRNNLLKNGLYKANIMIYE